MSINNLVAIPVTLFWLFNLLVLLIWFTLSSKSQKFRDLEMRLDGNDTYAAFYVIFTFFGNIMNLVLWGTNEKYYILGPGLIIGSILLICIIVGYNSLFNFIAKKLDGEK